MAFKCPLVLSRRYYNGLGISSVVTVQNKKTSREHFVGVIKRLHSRGRYHLDLAYGKLTNKDIYNQIVSVKSTPNPHLNNSSILLFNALGLSSIDLP